MLFMESDDQDQNGMHNIIKMTQPFYFYANASSNFNSDIAPEYIIGEPVHRDRLKLLQTIPVKGTVERGIKEGWLVQVMPSGKEVKPKWKSRKRKQFARVS